MTDPDIKEFVESIGATEPLINSEGARLVRRMFKRSNYFVLNGRFLIVKISRSNKPFWGVGKKFIDFSNGLDNYTLVLLTSASEGWLFSKNEINNRISSRHWALREADDNYKINSPLPSSNSFSTPAKFLEKLGV